MGQLTQLEEAVEPSAFTEVPAAQLAQSHSPGKAWYLPAAHGVHALASTPENLPVTQVEHTAALAPEKVPAKQLVQA